MDRITRAPRIDPAFTSAGNGLLGAAGNLLVQAARNAIDAFVAELVEGLRGATGGTVDLTGFLKGTRDDLDVLSSVALTEVTTGLAASSGPNDLPTFSRTQLARDSDGNLPTSTPVKSRAQFWWLRADRTGDFTRMKTIMGGDTAWFDIDHLYLALYKIDPTTQTLHRVWLSPDLDAVLSGTRKEYTVNMGQVVHLEQGEIYAFAQLQIAPGLAQTPRAYLKLDQITIEPEVPVFPSTFGSYLNNQSTLPETVAMSAMSGYYPDFVYWFALSP